jgi:hypothetical protein
MIDEKINLLINEMKAKFVALISSNRLLTVPIEGATIGGLGVVLLKLLDALR